QIKELKKNPTIISASERTVKEYNKGKSPSQIFLEHGFNFEKIGKGNLSVVYIAGMIPLKGFGEEGFSYGTQWKRKNKTPFFQAAVCRGST
ncbi:hypothetical protein, partial [Peribacillus simplex]|uniref:hypothetical protein n=1 Tax=Peribacillus simplex TaxID=1478 RepID=UPI0019D6914B